MKWSLFNLDFSIVHLYLFTLRLFRYGMYNTNLLQRNHYVGTVQYYKICIYDYKYSIFMYKMNIGGCGGKAPHGLG